MVHPRLVGSTTFQVWREYFKQRFRDGEASIWKIARELSVSPIGQGFSITTVARYLDKDIWQRSKESSKQSNRHRSELRKRARNRSRLRRSQYAEGVRRYEKYYRRITHNTGRYLENVVFVGKNEATLEDITTALRTACDNVPWRTSTIDKLLKRYAAGQIDGTIRGPPYLTQTENGWRYDNTPPDGMDSTVPRS